MQQFLRNADIFPTLWGLFWGLKRLLYFSQFEPNNKIRLRLQKNILKSDRTLILSLLVPLTLNCLSTQKTKYPPSATPAFYQNRA